MQDYYDILHVNKNYMLKMDETEKNAYIRQCYDEAKKKDIDIPKEIATINRDKSKLQKLNQLEEKYDRAYMQIGTEEGRAEYKEIVDIDGKAYTARIGNSAARRKFDEFKDDYEERINQSEKRQKSELSKYETFREKYQQKQKIARPPKSVLNIQDENFDKLTYRQKKDVIERKKEELLTQYATLLKTCKNFIERAEISIKINEIKEAYERLKLEIEEKRYEHVKEYKPDLIKGISESSNSIQNKVVIRQEDKKPTTMYLPLDKQRRNLRVKTIAKIGFKNNSNEEVWLYVYNVMRNVNGKEKSDNVCTPISIPEVLLDIKICKNNALEYCNCLVNQLLSEDVIKGAKSNGGFIGSIKQDEHGIYKITLDEEQLDEKEQEMLTATMMCKEKEKAKKEER